MKTLKFSIILVLIACVAQVMYAQTPQDSLLAELARRKAIDAGAYETQCTIYDDDQWYTAFNQKLGVEGDPQLANSLLRTCQEQLKDKLAGKVQAITTTYFDQMDIDSKSSEASHIESAGEQIIDQILNDTEEDCREFSKPDDSGYQNIYIGILVRKVQLVEQIIDGLENKSNLPADEKEQLRKNENAFRESAFKVFEISE